MLKLPRELTADPRHDAVARLLEEHRAPLFPGGKEVVATVPLTKGLTDVLRGALHMGLAVQGLELTAETLAAEQKGLDAAEGKRPEGPQNARVSRVLFLANDGSKRFYRDAEGLLLRHARRLLACRLDVAGEDLGQALFGQPKLVRSVLVIDKKVVGRALLSLLPAT